MITSFATGGAGERVALIGITAETVKKLTAGEPVMIDLTGLFGSRTINATVFYADTNAGVVEQYRGTMPVLEFERRMAEAVLMDMGTVVAHAEEARPLEGLDKPLGTIDSTHIVEEGVTQLRAMHDPDVDAVLEDLLPAGEAGTICTRCGFTRRFDLRCACDVLDQARLAHARNAAIIAAIGNAALIPWEVDGVWYRQVRGEVVVEDGPPPGARFEV